MWNEDQNKLRFTDWKVFIDNTSDWFDEINKQISQCYIETLGIKLIYPKIKTFASSRSANIHNYEKLKIVLNDIESVLYSKEYNKLRHLQKSSEWDIKILNKLNICIELLSEGLSEGELTPKAKKERTPFKKTGTSRDIINKALYETNKTTLNKDGIATTNNKRHQG